MTNLAAALADTSKLPDYLGMPVAKTTIKVTNAGDGLSKGLAIEPELMQPGEKVYVVLECVVGDHSHKVIKDAPGMWNLEQKLVAGTGTIIDADVVKEAIAEQAERIKLAEEAAQGIKRLDFANDGEADAPDDDGAGIQYGSGDDDDDGGDDDDDGFEDLDALRKRTSKINRDQLLKVADSMGIPADDDARKSKGALVQALFDRRVTEAQIAAVEG